MTRASHLAQVFSGDKAVDSPGLRRAGAQPIRAVLARGLYRLRQGSDDPRAKQLERDGVVLWENFLDPASLAALIAEVEDFMSGNAPTWRHEHGTTEVRHFQLMGVDAERYPQLDGWRYDPRVQGLVSAAERRNLRRIDGGSLIEHVTLGDYSVPDTQTHLHIDTFFNTHKLWLYLDDVTEDNAPLAYVPGSHRLDRARLRQEYRGSVDTDPAKSRSISDEEVQERGLAKRLVTCPRNTLMVVNTCGYHARSVGKPGATRLALHKSFRFNPFAPVRPPAWRRLPARIRSVTPSAAR